MEKEISVDKKKHIVHISTCTKRTNLCVMG